MPAFLPPLMVAAAVKGMQDAVDAANELLEQERKLLFSVGLGHGYSRVSRASEPLGVVERQCLLPPVAGLRCHGTAIPEPPPSEKYAGSD